MNYINIFSDIVCLNSSGKLHCEDGPALIRFSSGSKEWYINGKRHREDGPAIEMPDGQKHWYINGLRHRDNGPAEEGLNGSKYWFNHGVLHREDGPAAEDVRGRRWYIHGHIHREDGPAVEQADGTKEWYVEGRLHREDGPAIEFADGTKEWYIHGIKTNEKLVKNLNSLTVKDIFLYTKNVELLTFLIERFGWGNYLKGVNAKPIDSRDNVVENTKEALYKVLSGIIDGKIFVVTCPTGRIFALHVPYSINTCEQAQYWLGNDTKKQYNVIGRT